MLNKAIHNIMLFNYKEHYSYLISIQLHHTITEGESQHFFALDFFNFYIRKNQNA